MPLFRATTTFQAFTNLPADRYTNTLHFVYPSDLVSVEQQVRGAIRDFYLTFGSSYAAFLNRQVRVDVYDLSQPKPRVPITSTFTLPAAADPTPALPAENAVVLGFRAALPHTGSRRNRIYLGPFSEGVVQQGSSTAFPSVPASTRLIFLNAAKQLHIATTSVPASGDGWVVYSPTTGFTAPIAEWLMDAEVDIQRRRGYRTTDRTIVTA